MAKINRGVAGLAAVLGAAAFTQPAVAGSDLWWHLAAGRQILELGGVPTTDPFSWTFAGREWMHHEWLWGVGYALLYGLEPELVAWANLALLVAILGVGYAIALAHTKSALAAGAALWAAAAAMHWFFDIRPHEVTLLFVGLVVLTRERPWAPFLWPPLMVLWANLHGGFVFGFGAIGLYALVETLRRSHAARRLVVDRRLWLGVAATGLAFLCNPWGWRILEYPAAYLDGSSPYRSILEWQAPGFELDPQGFAGRFTWLALVACAGAALPLRERPRDAYLIALSGVALAMSITSRRFIPLFALCALPLVARAFAFAIERARAGLPAALDARLARATPFVALALGLLLWRGLPLTHLLERWTETQLYPRAALAYLRALDTGPRLLNHYNWGGYVMLHAPELRVWIDGRANTVYDDKVYSDYVSMTGRGEGLLSRLAQYPADAAFLPASSRLATALAQPQLGWRLVYADSLAKILLPPTSPLLRRGLPDPDAVLGDDPERLLVRAERALRAKRPDEARNLIAAALAQEPTWMRAYGQLAMTHASERDVAGIAAAIERGIAAEPREREKLRLLEAVAYEAAERPDLQLEALEAALQRGPFSRPEAVRAQIEALRAGLASR